MIFLLGHHTENLAKKKFALFQFVPAVNMDADTPDAVSKSKLTASFFPNSQET